MRVLVAVNGDPGSGPPPGPFGLIVAADGGAALCLAAGLRPDLVVGDMDSLAPALRQSLEAQGCRFLVHPDPVNKEETDLELALRAARRRRPDEIVLWGIWGGRPDHTLANVLSLGSKANAKVTTRAYASGWWLQAIRPGPPVTLPAPAGAVVSLLPLTSFVHGVVTTGLQYPLPAPWDAGSAVLPLGSARGVSNVVRDAPATVRITRGVLLAIWGNVS
jgi:thiamine pyrophosphokinase